MVGNVSLSRPRAAFAVAVVAMVVTATMFVAQAQAATTTCSGSAVIAAGDYNIQANEWNSSLQQCLAYTGGTAWSVTTANFNTATNGAPATYPSIYKGCHWGTCTSNSGLPLQASKLTSVTTSWSTTQTGQGMYNVAYDLWFNSQPTTGGQPDGTELMIWLNRLNAWPFGSQTGTASLDGFSWEVWTGRQSNWTTITYVLDPGATSFNNLDVLPLIKDATSRGAGNASHYLIDAEAGFEIWIGGQGLGVNSFSFSASAGGVTPTPTATPTSRPSASASASIRPTASPTASPTVTASSGSGGTANCSAAYSLVNSWGNGFVANVTVTNTGTAATKGWKVTWTWPGSQTITNSWSAAVSQSGTAVTATNLAYNGAIAAGGNTSFGFQGAFSGTNSNPSPSCSAT